MSARATYWALQQTGIKPIPKLVLLVLADSADQDNFASIDRHESIRRVCNISSKALSKALEQLINKKLITMRCSDEISLLFKLQVDL